MGNTITLPVQYEEAADLIYKIASLTSILDNGKIQIVGKNIQIKQISVQGPANYTRSSDYVSGDVTAAWVTKTPNYDRGRKFKIDAMDEAEFGGLYMDVLAEYIRTGVVPDLDAARFEKYYDSAGTKLSAALTSSTVLAAINVGQGALDTHEVPVDGRILFCESSLLRGIQELATTVSRETLAGFAKVVPVPQSRFYTDLTIYDGSTEGQEAGGYIKNATTGKNMNFLIVHPSAILQGIKRTVTPVDLPDSSSDSYRVSQRTYGIHEVHTQKAYGLYAHYSTS